MRIMQMLGKPTKMTEIIDSNGMDDSHLKESNWEKHNAVAIYDDSKWTYMDRPPIPLPLVA